MSIEIDLEGSVAIVTGAGRRRGIGRDVALGLARAGADVVVTGTGRDPDTFPPDERAVGWRDVDSVAEEITVLGRRALPLVCDVTDAAAVEAMVERVVAELGRIDMLVNNAAAAVGPDRVPVVELGEADWRRVLDVKLTGAFLASRAVARQLLAQGDGGSIVNVSSISARWRPANQAAYTAANIALESLSASMAKELAGSGIRCNTVVPGFFPTSRADVLDGDETWGLAVRLISARRAGTADDLAGMIAFLCSPLGSFVNGQSINVCGGQEWHVREWLRLRDAPC